MDIENIKEMAKYLKLSYTQRSIEAFLEYALAQDLNTEQAISYLLEQECEQRKINGVTRRLKRAHFPYTMRFELFKDAHLSPEVKHEIKTLKSMSFLEAKSNIVLIGNPGVGKTALSVALGTKACELGYTVAFINISNLVIELKEAMSLNEISAYKKRFERYDLVILDDLGYCSFNKECGEILLNLIASRDNKASTIITTNLEFERWNEVFNDPMLTGALVDRIAHMAHILNMTGDSYRVIETNEWRQHEIDRAS